MADEEISMRAECIEDASKLDGDVSGPDDSDTLRLFFEIDEHIQGDTDTRCPDLTVTWDSR